MTGNEAAKATPTGAENPFLIAVKEYIAIHAERQDLKARDDLLSRKATAMESALIDNFLNEGFDKVSVDGATVYLFEQVWAKANGTGQMVAAALKKAKLDEFISYSSGALSGYVRELIKQREVTAPVDVNKSEEVLKLLPKALREVVSVTNKTSLRVRRS